MNISKHLLLIRSIFFTTSIVLSATLVIPVTAQLETVNCGTGGGENIGVTDCNRFDAEAVIRIVRVVINFVLAFVSLIAVIAIIIAGLRYIMSQGDETSASNAKRSILYALIGLIIIGLAAAIVNTVITLIA